MSRRGVVDRDKGWNRIQREIKKARKAQVKVGVLGEGEGYYEGGDTTVLDVAVWNEFGTGNTPARPFIRGAYDQRQRELQRTSARLWNQVVAGRIDTNRAIGLLGEKHKDQVQEYMTALDQPPNAPSTIAAKGSSNPLIDEGRLRRSINWERVS